MKPLQIAHQTLLISLGPALIITLMLTSFFTVERLRDLEVERVALGQTVAEQLAPAAEYGLFSGNKAALESLIEVALRTPNIQHIEVLDKDQSILASAQKTLKGHTLDYFYADVTQRPIRLSDDFLNNGFEHGQYLETNVIGQIRVGVSRATFNQRQQQILLKASTLTLFALLLTYWLARRLADQIALPISAMAQAVKSIRHGSYRITLPRVAASELRTLNTHIGELANALEQSSREQQLTISALTQSREEAEQANRAKSDFLAMMSHELRTPLNGVLGMLQLFETTRMTHEQAEYLTLASESTTHLLHVINDILDFSRTERGSVKLESLSFSPKHIIASTFEALKPSAAVRGLAMDLVVEPMFDELQAVGDPTRLRQILVNLIGNAIKFTDQGEIQVVLQAHLENSSKPTFQCLVIDTGVGIEPECLPKIFEPFEQADNSISRRYGGTGLGLAIARTLAEHMGGTLTVQSSLGQGSTFILTLPLNTSHSFHSEQCPAPQRYPHTFKILLAEDNPVNQVVIEAMLRSLGHEVIVVSDGASVIKHLKAEPIDAIFMDCQLPLMDGYQATRLIRQESQFSHLPIIALTAKAMPGDREACLDAGMSDYLAKPLKRADLQQMLNTWLVHKNLEASQR